MTDTIPAGVSYVGNAWASSGSCSDEGGIIGWSGSVQGGVPVTITFGVRIGEPFTQPYGIRNTALVNDGSGHLRPLEVAVIVNGYGTYLPISVAP
jgi:hypothetical protein